MTRIKYVALALLSMILLPLSASAGTGIHGHFAAFFDNGSNPNLSFPDTVEGDDIEGPLLKIGAEMMLFTHSVNLQNGDVLNLQNDTLRDTGNGFRDFGLDCALTIDTDGNWTISGSCKSFVSGQDENQHIIKGVHPEKFLVWYKVFEDKKQGTAGYFMREKGEDYAK